MYEGIEQAYDLPAGVLDAVIAQESAGNPDAYRFEPGFYEHYIKGVNPAQLGGHWPIEVSADTERFARSFSWGLMQVMGQVAREMGFAGSSFATFARCPEIGVDFGARHLKAMLNRYGSLPDALSAYNAGHPISGNVQSYVNPILERMKA